MTCPRCGTGNDDSASSCVRCGSALVTATDAPTLAGVSMPPSPGGAQGKAAAAPAPARGSSAHAEVTAAGWGLDSDSPREDVNFGPRYRIEQMLGEGGMGAVYKAYDKELDRTVALKLIRPQLAQDPSVSQRFKQELLLASKITHKNILRIHDLGEAAGTKFISMVYVEGEDLHHLLEREGKLPLERTLKIARQLCSALEAAHAEGVVHRDFKPHNVLLDAQDNVFVSDFGLAKSLEQDKTAMTRTGEFLGTPRYMAPEQVEGGKVDHRADLYALGLILYEMVTADVPFKADTTMQLMYKRVHETPKTPKAIAPEVPEWFARLIMKCLARKAEDRYQSASEILVDLNRAKAPRKSGSITVTLPKVTVPRRRVGIPLAVLVAAIVIAMAVPSVRHRVFPQHKTVANNGKPVTVLVGDFTNHTGDPIFDDTLEPMFNIALEGASFINVYSRGAARKIAKQLPHPADSLDEQAALLVAVSQGVGTVVTGSLSRRGNGYKLAVEALDSRTAKSIASAEINAATKDELLLGLPKLAAPIRKALGDTTPESVQLAASGPFTAASVEVVHLYSTAMEQQFAGKTEDALRSFSKATELDPNFARAYSGMSGTSAALGRPEDGEKYIKLAMEHLDRMTERERYHTRAFYYFMLADYPKCVEEYSSLVAQYPADRIGQANLAACYVQLRNVPKATEAARKAVEIVPKGAVQRQNLSFLSSFGGDFQGGEREAKAALEINPASEAAHLDLAEAQLAQGHISQAVETYQALEKLSPRGASMAATGLGDLAAYQGRSGEAERLLERAAAADTETKKPEKAAEKFAALAYTQLWRGRSQAAIASANRALGLSQSVHVRFLAGRILAEAGETAGAKKIADGLSKQLQAEPQAYAKIIEAKVALKQGESRQAIKSLTDANNLLDTWIGRFELGRAYLEAGLFVEADSEFDRCLKRRGEALELFLDNVPTYSFLPPVYYYQGRVREALKSAAFADSYRTYLSVRGEAGEDPLLAEVRRRLGQ